MEIIHIFPPNNNKYKNLLDMNDEKKIIIYQVFTRLFGNNNNHCVYNGESVPTVVEKWRISH